MITLARMRELAAETEYRDWRFEVLLIDGHRYARVSFKDGDDPWNGRKWLLSEHMTEGELVQTLFKAVVTAEEHEIREKFLYRGRAIFGPHLSLEALYDRALEIEEREPVPV